MKTQVGKRIAELRNSKSISVDELAQRSGISVDQIQKIEENEILPSLSPLIKISRVLGVRLGTFLDDQEVVGPAITRSNARETGINFSNNSTNNAALNFFSLAPNKVGRNFEPFIIDISVSENKVSLQSSHEGEEFLFVLEGSVEVSYGKEIYTLSVGDSIYYESIIPHHVHSANQLPAKILAIVYAPN